MINIFKKKNNLKKTWSIKKEVLESIMEFSKSYYPREFAGMLVSDSSVIDDLYIFPSAKNYSSSVFIRPGLSPMSLKIMGSVHSHPSGSGFPSGADLSFFKSRQVNLIVYPPFEINSFKAYNKNGNLISIDVV
jgi:proteasome lid subunit RPN8/RPN11